MCWNGEASAAIAIGGLSSAYFLKKRGQPQEVYLPTAYFVLMEGLQAVTYTVVGKCDNSYNQWFTRLAIIHISFQPIFINMLGMHFIDARVKQRIKKYVYGLSFIAAAFCLMRLLPAFELLGQCRLGTALCSHTETCAFRGEWHIGWHALLNGFNEDWNWYIAAAFGLPVLYGSWKWSLYHYFVGPFLAALTTTNIHERPAVWCLFSTMIIAMLVNTPLRNYIYIKSWPLWPYFLRGEPDATLAANAPLAPKETGPTS